MEFPEIARNRKCQRGILGVNEKETCFLWKIAKIFADFLYIRRYFLFTLLLEIGKV